MKSLHSVIVNSFRSKIEGLTEVLSIEHGEDNTFVLVATVNDQEQRLEGPKRHLSESLAGGLVNVKVKPGTTLTEVYQKLSDDYGLYWVEGVDYTPSEVRATGLFTFEVPSSSFMWQGSVVLNFHVINDRCKDPIKVMLDKPRAAFLLMCHVFSGQGSFLTAKGNLTQKSAEDIVAHLKAHGAERYTVKDLQSAKVLTTFADRFSSLAVLSTKNKGNVFIRYNYEKDNVSPTLP